MTSQPAETMLVIRINYDTDGFYTGTTVIYRTTEETTLHFKHFKRVTTAADFARSFKPAIIFYPGSSERTA